MQKATILEIQRYSVHDGPGIRTTVFFKGCHLACKWCHNPESQDPKPEMLFYADRCIGCGTCAALCGRGAASSGTVRVEVCRACEKKRECAANCPAEALRVCGEEKTVDEVFAEVLRDRAFYGAPEEPLLSRGGVTCSGGEPLLQGEFLKALLERCRAAGIGTCVDTTLNVPWASIEPILHCTELFLADLKFMDDGLAARMTGRSYALARENLQRLSALGVPVIIRVPVAPGVNDTPEEERARGAFLAALQNVIRADRFEVTNHAARKYMALQRENWFCSRESGGEEART